MSNGASPSVSRLAGQLRYLFDERPELRAASPEVLRDLLSREDRAARAVARGPLTDHHEHRRRFLELDDRITLDAVRQARAMVVGESVGARATRPVASGRRRDNTQHWLVIAALTLWTLGLLGWLVNLSLYGIDRATWTGSTLLLVMGAAIAGAVWSYRDGNR